ncbi:MAG TPA: acetyl-CoA carboxylase biotin carboxyl carrier protein subunit [Bacteroidales bacterium]|nr:acetyl-CoA carboxylase biotin carboxyl carrier protein subunit [Bacteroidales bacterium]
MSKREKTKKDKKVEKFDSFYVDNSLYYTRVPDAVKNKKPYAPLNFNEILAFIPGTIQKIQIKVGDRVEKGDQLMILEAMKMDNVVRAPFSGKVKSILVEAGTMVRKNQTIVELE